MFNPQDEETKTFEIVLSVRDSQGRPTGKTKSYSTDSAKKLWQFFMNHQGKPKRRRKKNKGATSKQEADKILKDMYKDNGDN